MSESLLAGRFRIYQQAYEADGLLLAPFLQSIAESGRRHIEEASWRTSAPDLSVLNPTWTYRKGAAAIAVVEGEGIAHLRLDRDVVGVVAAGETPAQAKALMTSIRSQLPVAEQTDAPTIPVRFWALGPRGPLSVTRKLDAPPWSGVEGNYTAAIRASLITAAQSFRPAYGGQLLLWHGEPGTGKTWAIRSLAWEWRNWCDTEYIIDPEQFFGAEGAYLLQVLLEGDDNGPPILVEDDEKPARWRLLVMEDTGELLTSDAAIRSGKALSRFLNVVDGFIGQGLRVLVLLTTNEQVDRLHPAVARPGRTAMELQFGRMTPEESSAWAAERGLTVERRSHTLAELYAIAEARPRPQVVKEVGFGKSA